MILAMSEFGQEFDVIWPRAESTNLQFSEFGKKLLRKCQKLKKPKTDKINMNKFLRKSKQFPLEFGTNTCRVMSQPKERYPIIQQQIGSAYPIIHERVLGLYLAFLEHKCQYGTKKEIKIFNNLTLTEFVQRLLVKRCATFVSNSDTYLLVTGEEGFGNFEKIGFNAEKKPLLIKNLISYDEIKLSAFLSVSSHSEFINNGSRGNRGVVESDTTTIEREGVIIGLIGARFERRNVMEFQDIVISQTQNTVANGYGQRDDDANNAVYTRPQDYRRLWRQFYEEQDFLHDQVTQDGLRFGRSRSGKGDLFDNLMMKKRYAICFDTLLLESEARAATAGKRAYIHVVGFGLGVWKVAAQQDKIFLEVFAERIKALLPHLPHVAVVHFSWFHMSEWRDLKNGGILESNTHPDGGIRIFMSNRNPAGKLDFPEFDNILLIVSYAWDGNALPGNEFWMKALDDSGDPAAACSTLITELHNPHINTELVNGSNLHIASAEYGVLHVADYSRKVLEQNTH